MRKIKKWLTWEHEMWLVAGILFFCFMLSTLFKQGFFSNIGWILAGLLLVINPVCPEAWKWKYGDDEKRI